MTIKNISSILEYKPPFKIDNDNIVDSTGNIIVFDISFSLSEGSVDYDELADILIEALTELHNTNSQKVHK